MTDKEIINECCPLCVNILRLQHYLLSVDEVIMFDWLTVKQSLIFGYKPFYYSLERIEKETRLKRRRVERVIKRFCAMGILQVATMQKSDSPGRVRYFRVNFAEIVERLPEIIDQENGDAGAFKRYFKALANCQSRADKGKQTSREREDRTHAEQLYNALNNAYWNRIDMYNNGELTKEKPERLKTKTALTKDKSVINHLQKISERYDDETIKMAFIVLCDEFLKGEKAASNIGNLIKFYLTYKQETDSFNVVDRCIGKFQKDYSRPR